MGVVYEAEDLTLGRHVSNQTGNVLYSVPIEGGPVQQAKEFPPAGYVFFSRDGKYAAYVHGSPEEQFRTKCGVLDLSARWG